MQSLHLRVFRRLILVVGCVGPSSLPGQDVVGGARPAREEAVSCMAFGRNECVAMGMCCHGMGCMTNDFLLALWDFLKFAVPIGVAIYLYIRPRQLQEKARLLQLSLGAPEILYEWRSKLP